MNHFVVPELRFGGRHIFAVFKVLKYVVIKYASHVFAHAGDKIQRAAQVSGRAPQNKLAVVGIVGNNPAWNQFPLHVVEHVSRDKRNGPSDRTRVVDISVSLHVKRTESRKRGHRRRPAINFTRVVKTRHAIRKRVRASIFNYFFFFKLYVNRCVFLVFRQAFARVCIFFFARIYAVYEFKPLVFVLFLLRRFLYIRAQILKTESLNRLTRCVFKFAKNRVYFPI